MISQLSSSVFGSQLTSSHPIRRQSVSSIHTPLGLQQDSCKVCFQGNEAQSSKTSNWFSRTMQSPYTKLVSGGLLLAGGIAIKLLGLATVLGAPILLPIGLGVAAAGVGLMGWGGIQAFGKKNDASETGEAISQESPATHIDNSSGSVVSDTPSDQQQALASTQLVLDSSVANDESVESEVRKAPAADVPRQPGNEVPGSSGPSPAERIANAQSQQTAVSSSNAAHAAGSGSAVDLSAALGAEVPVTHFQQRQKDQAGIAAPNVSAANIDSQGLTPSSERQQSTTRRRPVKRVTFPRQANGTEGNVARNTGNAKIPDEREASPSDAAQNGSSQKQTGGFKVSLKQIGQGVKNYFQEGLGLDPISRARRQARSEREATYCNQNKAPRTETRWDNESHYY